MPRKKKRKPDYRWFILGPPLLPPKKKKRRV